MIISPTEFAIPNVQHVAVTDESLVVELEDGRTLTAPLGWFPRINYATPAERSNWHLVGAGIGIHWDDLDEDVSLESLLLGKRSGESQRSLERWLAGRMTNHEQKG